MCGCVIDYKCDFRQIFSGPHMICSQILLLFLKMPFLKTESWNLEERGKGKCGKRFLMKHK